MKFLLTILALVLSMNLMAAKETKTMVKKSDESTMTGPTQLDDLMRGELAALKAYDQALKDVKEPAQREKLSMIREQHQMAVNKISKFVAKRPEVKEDTESAGAWGQFAKAWTKTRSFTGNDGALKALKQGEEHGIDEYEEALNDDSISADLKKSIRTELIPNQKKHIDSLNKLI